MASILPFFAEGSGGVWLSDGVSDFFFFESIIYDNLIFDITLPNIYNKSAYFIPLFDK